MSNPDFVEKFNEYLNDFDNLNILKQHLLWSLMLNLSLCSDKYEKLNLIFLVRN